MATDRDKKSWRYVQKEPMDKVLEPLSEFLHVEALGAILLILALVSALVWANSPWAGSYHRLFSTPLTLGLGEWSLTKSLVLWIDEGLMAVFFFTVGLEIKREVVVGELAGGNRAVLPIAAAAGGVAVPALFYLALNAGGPGQHGWGIPMVTDIGFALGMLSIIRGRVPASLMVFLAALAIADDLGSVVKIALFYGSNFYFPAMAAAGLVWVLMILANKVGVRVPLFYFLTGLALWFAVLLSGVHSTVGGVLAALTIPATRRLECDNFLNTSRGLLKRMEKSFQTTGCSLVQNAEQFHIIQEMKKARRQVEPPLQRLEYAHHPWVAYFVMPVFILANAGVPLRGELFNLLINPVALGVILGLVLGKQAGIMGVSWLFIKMGWAPPLEGAGWRHIYGASCLCGIGFSMSLFMANQSFSDPALLEAAKVGIFAASALCAVMGWLVLGDGKAEK